MVKKSVVRDPPRAVTCPRLNLRLFAPKTRLFLHHQKNLSLGNPSNDNNMTNKAVPVDRKQTPAIPPRIYMAQFVNYSIISQPHYNVYDCICKGPTGLSPVFHPTCDELIKGMPITVSVLSFGTRGGYDEHKRPWSALGVTEGSPPDPAL